MAHDVVEGFLVRGTGAQHGVALDPVEFPFDTCVIQIEAFGQAGQHVLARFSVHYGKFREELPQLRINTNLLMFYIFLCFGFTPTVSCHPAMDGIPLPGAYGRRRVRPIFKSLGADRSSGARVESAIRNGPLLAQSLWGPRPLVPLRRRSAATGEP